MRTNYNNFERRRGARVSLGTGVGIIFLTLLIATALFWRQGASALLWRALAPVVAVRDALQSSQVSVLRAELASTSAALADRDLLRTENADLKARLGRPGVEGHTILAGVLMAPPAAAYDTLVIDAGTAQGVAVGDRVSAGGATVIGTITDVSADTAHVMLFSAPGAQHDALIVSKQTGATMSVSVAGQGAGSFTAQLPAGSAVAVGDSVVFAGVAGQFAARVIAIDAKPGESFVNLYLQMPVNIFDLRYVEVLH